MGLEAAAGISALAGIAGGALSSMFGRSNMKKQADMTSGLMAQQFAYDKEKMQNAWQWTMDDLQKAGLNPTLMMGNASSPTIAGGSAGSAGGTSNPNVDLTSSLAALKEIGLMDAQKRNIEADTKNKEQQFELTPGITKAAIELNNTQSALNRAQKEKTLEEQINTNLQNHAQEIINRNLDLDYNKRRQAYDKEMAEYIGQLSLKLREIGLKDNDIYTAINAAFETAGKLFRVVDANSTSTSNVTSTSTSNVTSKSTSNVTSKSSGTSNINVRNVNDVPTHNRIGF